MHKVANQSNGAQTVHSIFLPPYFRLPQVVVVAVALGALALGLQCARADAETNSEQQCIQVLQSGASPMEKDAACARLKFIGTGRAVPALAALLNDEQLSHSARYALEGMRLAEAGQALLAALDHTHGLIQAGIIESLGQRGEAQAVPALGLLLADSDTVVAAAAARALGRIGGPQALKALQAEAGNSAGPVHQATVDALLRCANTLLEAGSRSKALAIFKRLYNTEKQDAVRTAAFRGMICASGNRGLKLMTRAIAGPSDPGQTAALQLVRAVNAPGATRALAQLLPKVEPPIQVALIDGLCQRGDVLAAPAVTALAISTNRPVRLAALQALGTLGDATVVPVLAEVAAAATGQEQQAARQALLELRRGKVTAAMVIQLEVTPPAEQAELARALGERGDQSAVPRLLGLAQSAGDSTRLAALQALGLLVDEPQLDSLVQCVLKAKDDAARAEAAKALNIAYQRLQFWRGRVDGEPLAGGLALGSPEARLALLPVCSGVIARPVRVALRGAAQDSNLRVRAAALRALCDTIDPGLLDDLVNVSRGTVQENVRTLAIAGCVRLTSQEEAGQLSPSQRLNAFKTVLAGATRPEQKRMILAGLGGIPDPEALRLVEPLLEDSTVQNEAAQAAIKIAAALPPAQAQTAMAVLKKVAAGATEPPTRQAAEAALDRLEADLDYLTAWQVTGPYRQAGKDCAALFDLPFGPELAERESDATERGAPAPREPEAVNWRPLPPGADPNRPWLMDLLRGLGGGQDCVAYARTWVHCDQEQPARLELGSDDGVKVWLNHKLVHARNVSRALQRDSDKVEVTLRPGWNLLLFKITQNNQGWEFCARFLKPDGSRLGGLQCDATPRPE